MFLLLSRTTPFAYPLTQRISLHLVLILVGVNCGNFFPFFGSPTNVAKHEQIQSLNLEAFVRSTFHVLAKNTTKNLRLSKHESFKVYYNIRLSISP